MRQGGRALKLASKLLKPTPATSGNALVYALWLAGFIGAAVTALTSARVVPISERDFVSIWVAGKLVVSGHPAQVFDIDSLRAAAAHYAGTTYKIAFPYPPHILFFAVPLSYLPLTASFFAWQAISATLFYVAARPYLPSGMPAILAVLTPAAVVNVTYGQNGFFVGALWLFAFRGSAFAAALLTIKPNVGFLVFIEMIRRKLVVKTSIIAVTLILLSVLAFGWVSWRSSISNAAMHQFSMIAGSEYPNWSVQMTTPLVGYGYVGWLAFAAAAAVLLKRCFDVFTASAATFLISPYAFHYDMTVVCLGFGVLLFSKWRSLPSWQTLVCGLAYLSPIIVRVGTWLIPPLLLVGLYVLTEHSSSGESDHA